MPTSGPIQRLIHHPPSTGRTADGAPSAFRPGSNWLITLNRQWAAYGGAKIRALYFGDAQAWELQETKDVVDQIGNIVFFDYYQPVAFAPVIEAGLTWKRQGR